eukprot:SAG31_NODE_20235_length_580_cov_1.216216_1_plen_88_part_10
MQVHPQYFPDIIGIGGRTINAIKAKTGVTVNIPSVPPGTARGSRQKTLKVGLAGSEVRGYFLVFVQLFEKYGTLIERYTALIEKVSAL